MRSVLYLAFLISGVAGLLYEIVWSRYLALFLGHSAYAQILVIAVYLGGMALGALAVGERSKRLARPLVWYVGAELVLAGLGVAFHLLFQGVTGFAYGVLLPGLGGGLADVARWSLALALVLPPAVVLGTTFPLMAAAVLRIDAVGPGRTVADLYFFNSLGAAAGALIGGFALLALVGLPGTAAAAAALNAVAALLALRVARRTAVATGVSEPQAPEAGDLGAPPGAGGPEESGVAPDSTLWSGLLAVAFGTAVASFIYEVAWIRMLSLVMGSANHSFEIILSAFILGLALGARLIRRLVDATARPTRLLGLIQWLMGLTALATLPLYLTSFDLTSVLVLDLPLTGQGYALFSVARYGIALMVMLPSTILAGMTLPMITAVLLRSGAGERAVGWVYGVNTLGSVSGVALAGLILLPTLGLENMLLAGAGLDMALGVVLVYWAGRRGEGLEAADDIRGLARSPQLALLTVVALAGVGYGVELSRAVLTGGVFRHGSVPSEERPVLFYEDGLTATVGVHVTGDPELLVLTTNGKADASLGLRWVQAATEDVGIGPIQFQDEATQMLASLVTLAHAPEARSTVIIGHGSGASGHYLLGSPNLDRAVTVEIEPQMINASRVYYPANRRVFDDPRHTFVLGDAKAFLAEGQERFDVVFSEPSNPWVSGVASLFTVEFYRRVRQHLAPGGVFSQWIQLYELNDQLLLSVLAALHEVFPSYRAFLVGDTDLMVVASSDALPEADWGVLAWPAVAGELDHLPPLTPEHMEALWLFDRSVMAPLMDQGLPMNSDFHPILDLGMERARFLRGRAEGAYALALDRFDLAGALVRRRAGFGEGALAPAPRLAPMRSHWLGGVLRTPPASRGRGVPEDWPGRGEMNRAFANYALFQGLLASSRAPSSWSDWLDAFLTVEAQLHAETAGAADEAFFGGARAYLKRHRAPSEVRAVVDFVHGLAAWDFREAADALDGLVDVSGGPERLPVDLLLDGGVVARLEVGDVDGARGLFEALREAVDRDPGDLRMRLLNAWLVEAEES